MSGVSWWTVLRDPAFIARRRLLRAVRDFAREPGLGGGLLVDVGCGSKPYDGLFAVDRYVGVDVEESGHPPGEKRCDLYYDGVTLPFERSVADIVLCTQVLEHAPDPVLLLTEIARVLRPRGHLLLTAPFLWEEHETPYDFTRFTSFGIGRLLAETGFQVQRQDRTTGTIEALAQMSSIYVHREIGRGVPVWSSLVTLLLCAPLQVFGLLLGAVLPDSGRLFLDSAVLAVRAGNANDDDALSRH